MKEETVEELKIQLKCASDSANNYSRQIDRERNERHTNTMLLESRFKTELNLQKTVTRCLIANGLIIGFILGVVASHYWEIP